MTDIFSTYEAADLARNYKTHGKLPIQRISYSNGKIQKHQSNAVNTIVYSSESDADSDALSKIARPVTKPTRAKGKKKSDLRDRIEKKRGSRKKKRTDDDEDDDSSDDDRIDATEVADLQAEQHSPVSRSRRTSKIQWSSSEDAVLRRLYKLYAGSHSVFAMIAQDSTLIELGGNKNSQKIEKRVQQLELHLELANMLTSSEEEEEEKEDDMSESSDASVSDKSDSGKMSEDDGEGKVNFPTTKPKKRKRKEKKEKKKEKVKKQKSKSKSNSKYFINPDDKEKEAGGDNADNDADETNRRSQNSDNEMDQAAGDELDDGVALTSPPPNTWPLGSPSEVYSQSMSKSSSVGGGGEVGTAKPFWEDDLDEEDGDENSFEQRMSALAARGPGIEASAAKSKPVERRKKKSLLKKQGGGNVALSDDDSDNDLDIVDDGDAATTHSTTSTGNYAARSSVLIDSDDEE